MNDFVMKDRDRDVKTVLFLVIVLHAVILIIGVWWRFVDGDEGGMLVVAREVINGRVPILEINAHNQPLLYYFYGAWMKVFGFSIVSGRSLSAIAMFATGLFLVWISRRLTEDWKAALILYLLYATNLTFFKTNLPVKPFALSNALSLAAFAVLAEAYIRDRRFGYATLTIAGLCLGSSMGVRLIFVLPFVFALWLAYAMIVEKTGFKDLVKRLSVFTAATTVPILPAIWIFVKEPVRAYAIWAGAYAQIYLGRGNNPDFFTDVHGPQKYGMIKTGLYEVVTVPDTVFLLVLLIISVAFVFFEKGAIEAVKARVYLFAGMIFLSIIYVYSNLYGNYLGYVNQLVPFALVLIAPLAGMVSCRLDLKRLVIAASVVSIVVVGLLYWHFQARLNTSIFYMFGSKDVIITPAFVDKISDDVIEKITKKDDVVLDTWGVFVFESGRRPVEGFEYPTDNALFWKLIKIKENARKYLYIPEPELFKMIENQEIPLLVLGDPKELGFLLTGEHRPDDQDPLLRHAGKHYDLYDRYFVKPTNAWVLLYVPKVKR